MPVDKQVLLRYQVLNECFRNKYRDYTIDDLVDECSKAMREKLDIMDGVSKRTIQNDIANLEMPPYNIRLDENLKSGRKHQWDINGLSLIRKDVKTLSDDDLGLIVFDLFNAAASQRILYLVDKYITADARVMGEELMRKYDVFHPILRHKPLDVEVYGSE